MPKIMVKRVYDPPAPDDGERILVDRLWARGLKKADAKVDLWLREVAPSNELRKWFGHDPEKWESFKTRYFKELDKQQDVVTDLMRRVRSGRVTLLFGAKDVDHNNAIALREYIQSRQK